MAGAASPAQIGAMSVRAFHLPIDSDLRQRAQPGDFLDSYAVTVADPALTPLDYASRLARMPAWVNLLMALRNRAVAPFGLKTQFGSVATHGAPAVGDYVGIFRLEKQSRTEAILGENDKHLDFRISVYKTSDAHPQVALSTWVHPHNRFGRAYLWTVMPFHKLIVRTMLASIAR